MLQSETSVLIVGSGPVGMIGALLFRQLGVDVRLIERRESPSTAPAAHVVNARTFEICRAAGVNMTKMMSYAVDPSDGGRVVWWTRLAGEAVSSLPFERQGDDVLQYSPTPLRNLGQHNFERVLREELIASDESAIEWGKEWQASAEKDGVTTSVVKNIATGQLEEIRSRFLIAADGAGSRVRKAVGIEMQGPPKLRSFVMIHFEANFRELIKHEPGILHWLMDPELRAGGFIAHNIDKEWVLMLPFDDQVESLDEYTVERCEQMIRNSIDVEVSSAIGIIQVTSWNMSAQVAERFREGSTFLAGDAAHRFPPAGGLGLNSGVQDIHGLAWRLYAVLQGWSSDSVLDSYEVERRRVAQMNTEQSLRNAQKIAEIPQALGTMEEPTRARMENTLANPEQRRKVIDAIQNQAEHFDMLGLQLGYRYPQGALVDDGSESPKVDNLVREYVPNTQPGARLPHVWLEKGESRCSSLDLIKPGVFTLLTARGSSAWDAAAQAVPDVPIRVIAFDRDVKSVDGSWDSVSELDDDGAILIRPDQHVGWRSKKLPTDPATALRSALDEILGQKQRRQNSVQKTEEELI